MVMLYKQKEETKTKTESLNFYMTDNPLWKKNGKEKEKSVGRLNKLLSAVGHGLNLCGMKCLS